MKLPRLCSRRTLVLSLAALLAVVAATMAIWAAIAGPVTVYRVARHGDTQIDDFKHYPARPLAASDAPFRFADATAQGRVPATETSRDGQPIALGDFLLRNDTIAFVVVKGDALAFEAYYQGHEASSLSQVFSVSKSVTSVLIGAALQDGLIRSVDQPITDFVPELAANGFDRVTLRHLLTMTSGSSYIEDDNPFGIHVILNYIPDIEGEILGFRVVDEPGTIWRYTSGDNALLALALRRAPRR
ncbi:MAG: beta-lactamase family protein [SAR202 cluster bacterium]|nr:beta-lactamase family protein [SAR202 cluster bacterium]